METSLKTILKHCARNGAVPHSPHQIIIKPSQPAAQVDHSIDEIYKFVQENTRMTTPAKSSLTDEIARDNILRKSGVGDVISRSHINNKSQNQQVEGQFQSLRFVPFGSWIWGPQVKITWADPISIQVRRSSRPSITLRLLAY